MYDFAPPSRVTTIAWRYARWRCVLMLVVTAALLISGVAVLLADSLMWELIARLITFLLGLTWLIGAASLGTRIWLLGQRQRRRRCLRCDYPMVPRSACPECGEEYWWERATS